MSQALSQTEVSTPPAQMGENELRLHLAKTRDELEAALLSIRDKLDLRVHAERAWVTMRRDVGENPQAYIAAAVGIGVVGAVAVIAAIRGGSRG